MGMERTLKLLNELRELRFNDEAFWRLHHFRNPTTATIARFRAYCERHSEFIPGGENERVHERLDFVLKTYRERGHAPGQSKEFIDLAETAFVKIPPRTKRPTE